MHSGLYYHYLQCFTDSVRVKRAWEHPVSFLKPNCKLSLVRKSPYNCNKTNSKSFDITGVIVIGRYISMLVMSPCLSFNTGLINPNLKSLGTNECLNIELNNKHMCTTRSLPPKTMCSCRAWPNGRKGKTINNSRDAQAQPIAVRLCISRLLSWLAVELCRESRRASGDGDGRCWT